MLIILLIFLAPYSKDQNRCDTYFPMLFNEECKQQIALAPEIRLTTLKIDSNIQNFLLKYLSCKVMFNSKVQSNIKPL